MTFCVHCGANNDDASVFCLMCGHRLYHEVATPAIVTKQRRFPLAAAVSVALICIAVIAAAIGVRRHQPKEETRTSSVPSSRPRALPVDAVLTIVAKHRDGNAFAQGSGFLLTPDGLAASNYHVLDGAALATAECCSGKTFEIRTIEGLDVSKDLVVFQLFERGASAKPAALPYINLKASDHMELGTRVIAIGSPQGLENTISDGILSAIREDKGTRYLQITAPISHGSSGGPILDENGDAVGVATFQMERGQNLNFAIAAEYLRPLMNQHSRAALSRFDWNRQGEAPFETRSAGAYGPPQPQRPTTGDEAETLTAVGLTGSFTGVVHNATAGESATFGVLIRDDNGTLVGCMSAKRPLFGSGSLTGIAYGRTVSFTVDSAIGRIVFAGRANGPAIEGDYQVIRQDSSEERGAFTLRKVNSDGPKKDFELSNCPTNTEMQ